MWRAFTTGLILPGPLLYNDGTNGYDSGKANQEWNGRYYEIQMEWHNHARL